MSGQFKRFAKSSALDFLMTLVLALALGYAVLSGFESTLVMRTNIGLMALVIGGLLLILYAGGWSRGARVVSIVGVIVYAVAAMAVALFLTAPEALPFADGTVNDVEGNHVIFVIVLTVVGLLVYLLSRSRAGALVLAFLAVFTCGVVQYLFPEWISEEGGFIVFVTCLVVSIMLVIYRRYVIGVTKTDHHARLAFAQVFALGLGVCAITAGIAAALFALVIMPLNLQTPVLKPFEHRIIPPIVDYTGAYDEYLVENPDVFTSLLNEKEDATSQNASGGSVPDEEQTETNSSPLMQFLQSMTIFSEDDWTESFDPVSYDRLQVGIPIALVLVIVALLVLVILRIRRRDVRLKRLREKPYAERVVFLYGFLLSRLKRLKLGKPETSTPLEFAFDSRKKLVPFTRKTGKVDLVEVTLIYQRAVYGSEEISAEDYAKVERYYRAFFNNAHRYMGTPRWLVQFWRI